MNFGVKDGDGGGAGISRIVKLVSSCSHADTVSFFFLEADVADEVGIGHFAAVWNIFLAYGEKGTGAFDSFIGRSVLADSMFKESSEFIGIAFIPSFGIGAFEEGLERCLFSRWGDGFSGKSGNVVRIHVSDGSLSKVPCGRSIASVV